MEKTLIESATIGLCLAWRCGISINDVIKSFNDNNINKE